MSIPIEIGTDEQFAALRRLLERENYTEDTVCKRFGIDRMSSFEDVPDREQVEPWDKDITGLLIRLFIETRFVPETKVAEMLGAESVELLETLGLVHGNADNPEEVWSPVSLVPYAGVWSVCDSWHSPDRSVLSPRDPVYAPIVSNAHRFLQYMPKMKCERLLELCCGTAFAALHAAKNYADHSYAFDISPRSVTFRRVQPAIERCPERHHPGRRSLRASRWHDVRPHHRSSALRSGSPSEVGVSRWRQRWRSNC